MLEPFSAFKPTIQIRHESLFLYVHVSKVYLFGMQSEDEMAGMAAHQRKASNVYGGSGPPQKSPRLWKFAPARGGNANNTGVLPFEAVSALVPVHTSAMPVTVHMSHQSDRKPLALPGL